jgi:biotin operon repressor/transposase
MKLTKEQQEVYNMSKFEFMSMSQIAHQRKTTRQAVYKIFKKLRGKGFKVGGFNRNQRGGGYPHSTPHKIRLHNQHFVIKIIRGSDTYRRAIKTKFKLDDNTIQVNKQNLEVYSNKDFFGDTPSEAYKLSMDYFFNLFHRIEDRLRVLLVKDGYLNIKEVRSHYSEINNELAIDNHKRGEKLTITGEDKKQWLKTDNSFNMNELETVHPELSKEDMEKIKPFFNDLRKNPMTLSQISNILKNMAEQNLETARGLGAVVNLLGINLKKEQEQEVKEINKKLPEYIG